MKQLFKSIKIEKGWLTLALFLPLLLSCGSNDASVTYETFASLDSLEVIMPEEYLQVTNWTTYKRNQKTILVEYGVNSRYDLIIHQVDFEEKKYLDPIIIKRDGPNGYNSSTASVYFSSYDSIFVFPAARPNFLLYNQNGALINEYPYHSEDYSRYYRGGFYSSAVVSGQDIFMTTVNDRRYDDPLYLTKNTPTKIYNFDKKSFVKELGYPKFTHDKFVPTSFTGPTIIKFDENSILINYRFTDSLYHWNYQKDQIERIYLGSKLVGSGKLLDSYPERSKALEYKIYNVNYVTAFKHNNKIYRVVNYVKDEYSHLGAYELLLNNKRSVGLLELDLTTREIKTYEMPIAKYLVFSQNKLYAGGVLIREEDDDDTFKRFYIYDLNP